MWKRFEGSSGNRLSGGTTIVPSFRFNKADDEMVEVTPTSSFDEIEDTVSNIDWSGSVQDVSPSTYHSFNKGKDSQFHNPMINSGSYSIITKDSIDEFYRSGDDKMSVYAI